MTKFCDWCDGLNEIVGVFAGEETIGAHGPQEMCLWCFLAAREFVSVVRAEEAIDAALAKHIAEMEPELCGMTFCSRIALTGESPGLYVRALTGALRPLNSAESEVFQRFLDAESTIARRRICGIASD